MTEETPYTLRSKHPRKLLGSVSGTPAAIYESVQKQKQEQVNKEMAKTLDD